MACNSIRRKEVLTSESLARWRGGEKPGVSEREDVLPSNERNRRARFPHPARKDDDSSTRYANSWTMVVQALLELLPILWL